MVQNGARTVTEKMVTKSKKNGIRITRKVVHDGARWYMNGGQKNSTQSKKSGKKKKMVQSGYEMVNKWGNSGSPPYCFFCTTYVHHVPSRTIHVPLLYQLWD